MVNTKVNLCGIELDNPVIPASGTFGYGYEYAELYDINCLGTFSFKGTTKDHRFGNPTPRIAECTAGMINAVGLQNPGVEKVISEELPKLKKCFHKPVMANISGFSVEDYAYTCEKLDKEEQVGWLEVNVSCPNVHGGGMSFGTSPEMAAEVTRAVKAGKVRAIGVSNCYAYQLAKANALAEKEGFEKFVSVQGHYNLIFREEEREMAKLCREDNIAMTPYSALAAGRLSRMPGETTKRLELDTFAKGKYDATEDADTQIIRRVAELSAKYGVSMTEVSLAWLLTKVTSPVVGMTKPHHVDGAVNAMNLQLTAEDCAYLEELYVPHKLVGVMANI